MSNSPSTADPAPVEPPVVDGRRIRIPGWSLWLAFAAGLLCVVAAAGHNLYRELRARQILDASTFILSYELADSLPLGLDHLPEWLLPAEMSQRLDLLRPVDLLYLNPDTRLLLNRDWQAMLEVCSPSLNSLILTSPNLTEAQFAELISRCPHLKWLHLSCGRISNSWLVLLAECREMAELSISDTGDVTAGGLRHLARLPRLSCIQLYGTRFGASEFEQLARYPALEAIEFIKSSVYCDECHTQSLPPGLRELSLAYCDFTPATLENMISGCPQLSHITLSGDLIEPGHLQPLADLLSLKKLDLSGTSIGDDAIAHLVRCRSLQTLGLADTRLTSTGIAELRRRLPHCTVGTHLSDGHFSGDLVLENGRSIGELDLPDAYIQASVRALLPAGESSLRQADDEHAP